MTMKPILPGQLHHLVEEARSTTVAVGLCGIVEDQQLGPRVEVLAGVGDVRQELRSGRGTSSAMTLAEASATA